MIGKVILVDKKDNPIGLEEKIEAHRKGDLHRAISVYIFNSKNQLLMQQRAINTYHSPLMWTNTCCSNCYEGETADYSAHRSLKAEMGFDCDLKEEFSQIYKADCGNNMIEHEFLHVFFGRCDKDPNIDKESVNDWKWVEVDDMIKDAKANPEKYSAWLEVLLKGKLPGEIKNYLDA
jgi:isopentenyl-diphosphate Delta-isomerase